MPAWSLQTALRTARTVAARFVAVLLTGSRTHDGTRGDLDRLDRWTAVRRFALAGLTVAAAGWVATRIPPATAAWLGSGLLFGGLVVVGYVATTVYDDYSPGR